MQSGSEAKQKAKSILKELCVPISSAHELFYRQIIAHRSVDSLFEDCGI